MALCDILFDFAMFFGLISSFFGPEEIQEEINRPPGQAKRTTE
jgi:hypothetical protein